MLAFLQVIGHNGIPHPFGPVLLLRLHGVLVIRHRALGNRIGEDTLAFLGIVDTCRGADMKTLHRVDIDEGVSEDTPVYIFIVFIAVEPCQRVFTVRITAYRTGKITVLRIYRQ